MLLYNSLTGSLTQLCLTLCDSLDSSPPSASVHGTFQARMLEWVAITSSGGSSPPRDQTRVSKVFCITDRFLIAEPLRKPIIVKQAVSNIEA